MLRYVLKVLYRKLTDLYKLKMKEGRNAFIVGTYDKRHLVQPIRNEKAKDILHHKMFTEASIYKIETRETLIDTMIRYYFWYMDEIDFLLFLAFPIAVTSLMIRFTTRFCCRRKKFGEKPGESVWLFCSCCRSKDSGQKVAEEVPEENK